MHPDPGRPEISTLDLSYGPLHIQQQRVFAIVYQRVSRDEVSKYNPGPSVRGEGLVLIYARERNMC